MWLLSRYEPGEIAAALLGGATLRMSVADDRVPINFANTAEIAPTEAPDPNGALPLLAALLGLAFQARRPGG